jgi:DNA-binding CsgD family transcriptional regulator
MDKYSIFEKPYLPLGLLTLLLTMIQDITTLPTMLEYTHRVNEIYRHHHFEQTSTAAKPDFVSLPFLAGIFFVLDIRTGHYRYLSEGFPDDMKNSYEALKREGFKHFLSMVHKNDYPFITDVIFKRRLQFMQTIPREEQGNYCYTKNFRLLTDNNTYKQILQHMIISETDELGMHLVVSGVCVDISMYKRDTTIVDTASKLLNKETSKIMYEDVYYPDENDVEFLTSREKKIIQLIAAGSSNKEIAAKLNISFHTVKAHRRNIREKTQTTNAAQLIEFGKKNGVV